MFKSNDTKFNIISTLVILFIILVTMISGFIISKKTDFSIFTMSKKRDVVLEEKVFEIGEENVLVANVDETDFAINAATPREKIASRAFSARQARGEGEEYISLNEVAISPDMDLSITTGLSKSDFVSLISNCSADTSGFFEENAELIYDLCQIYSINEIFFCGLISAESGWNIAGNHRSTYNYISLMVGGKLLQFDSVEDGLESAAIALHNNYLTPGGKFYRGSTLEGVRTIFCSENPGWTSLVYGRMRQII